MPNLGSSLSRHSNVSQKVITPERKISPVVDEYASPIHTTALPTRSRVAPPVFNYLQHLEQAKEKKKRPKIKLLPGEKILVDLEKQLQSRKKRESKEKHVDMLTQVSKKYFRFS